MKHNSIRLITLLADGETFKPWIAEDFQADFEEPIQVIFYGLSLQQPELISGTENSVDLKNQGIVLSKFESSSRLYYLENGQFLVYWMGD
ncbi:MAG: hypothetical protein IH596_15600 [Bacteroidales bacterium]|nr:hypothetical protein [Bacteroidales bacterium]